MAWPVRYRLVGLLAGGSMINDAARGLVAAVSGHCRGVVDRGPGIVFSGCSGTD